MKISVFVFLILFPALTFSQQLTEDQKEILEIHSVTIDQNNSFDDSNWDSISDVFTDKELVLLGEFNHGSKEVFEIRNSLIKFLHQQHDFDVILFEAGMGELIFPNFERQTLAPEQMRYGFFGGWRTTEFTDLMEYIKDQNLQIAGFDVQRFGRSYNSELNTVASEIIADSTVYNNLEERYDRVSDMLREGGPFDSLRVVTDDLITEYQMVYNMLSAHSEKMKSPRYSLTAKTLLNRIAYLRYFLEFNNDRNWNKRWAARDSAMTENVEWLSQNIFKDKKIIVVAHNFHISRYNEKEQVMGELLSSKFGDKMYSVGTFAAAGSYANNSGEEEFMSAPDSTRLDIKHMIEALQGNVNYLALSPSGESALNFLNNKIIVNDTFIDLYGTNEMALAKHFDGLLLLKNVSPPIKQ